MCTNLRVLISVVLLVISCANLLPQVAGQNHGDPCGLPGNNAGCDSTLGLICNANGLCDCSFPTMVFNDKALVCEATVGHQCSEEDGLNCVENATCVNADNNGDSRCVCDEGFEQVATRNCDAAVIGGILEFDPTSPNICCPSTK